MAANGIPTASPMVVPDTDGLSSALVGVGVSEAVLDFVVVERMLNPDEAEKEYAVGNTEVI